MSQWIRQGSNQEIRLDVLPHGECVFIQGSNGYVKIKGDVGGTIIVQGSNGMVKVGGVIRKGARITIQGSNPVLKHHGRESGANVTLQGSNAEEIDKNTRIDTMLAEKLKDKYPDIPVLIKGRDAKVLTVQKSQRPREQWGT